MKFCDWKQEVFEPHKDELSNLEAEQLFQPIAKPLVPQYFVNAALVVCASGGKPSFVHQPKLLANKDEQPQNNKDAIFLPGALTRVISMRGCNFSVGICFDQIGRTSTDESLESFERVQRALFPQQIDYLFIPQLNEKPKHETFLHAARRFYERLPHQHQATSLIGANASSLVVDGKTQEGYGWSHIYLPHLKKEPRVEYAACQSEVTPTSGADLSSVRFPSPVKVVSIEETTEALLQVEASVPGQPRVQRTPDYDHSVLVRVWRWEPEAEPFRPGANPCASGSDPAVGGEAVPGGAPAPEGAPLPRGAWVLPNKQLRHQMVLRGHLEEAIRRAPRRPGPVLEELAGIEHKEKASLAEDAPLKRLMALALASAEYWSGDMNAAVEHALQAAPDEASPAEARRALTIALRALTISAVTRWDIAQRATSLLKDASNDEFVLALAAYAGVVGTPGPSAPYNTLLHVLESPFSRARLRGIEALAAWYQDDRTRAKELYLLALDELRSLPLDLKQALQADITELELWWTRCIQRLEESLDKKFGWSEILTPLFKTEGSAPATKDLGAVARAELAVLRSLRRAHENSSEFDTELLRLKHLALDSGLYPVLFSASLYEFRFALDHEDVDRLLTVLLNITITDNVQSAELAHLLARKDPSEPVIRSLLIESARRLARIPRPQELATAALHLLHHLLPYAADDELEVIMEAAERVLIEAPPKLNVVLDMRTPAFQILKQLTAFADASISSWVLHALTANAFTQLERMAPPTIDTTGTPNFADTYYSERKRELTRFDYRDPSHLASFLEQFLERIPLHARKIWGDFVLRRVLDGLEQIQNVLSSEQVANYESRTILANAIRWASAERVAQIWQRMFAPHLREGLLPPGRWSREQRRHILTLCAALFALRPSAVPEKPREQVFEYLLNGLQDLRHGVGRQDVDVLLYDWCKNLGEAYRLRGLDAYLSLLLRERDTPELSITVLVRVGSYAADLLHKISRANEFPKRFRQEFTSIVFALLEPERYEDQSPLEALSKTDVELMLACLYGALIRDVINPEPIPSVAEFLSRRAFDLWDAPDEQQAKYGLLILRELAPVLQEPLRLRAMLTVHAAAIGRQVLLRSYALDIIAFWSDWLPNQPLQDAMLEAVAVAAASPSPLVRIHAAWATAKLGWAQRLASAREKLERDRNHLVRAQFARAHMAPETES
jgi:hypothetical protein